MKVVISSILFALATALVKEMTYDNMRENLFPEADFILMNFYDNSAESTKQNPVFDMASSLVNADIKSDLEPSL